MKNMKMKTNHAAKVEVLSFMKGSTPATIVTDGERHKSFEFEASKDHATLTRAIAYLEAKGYSIVPDAFIK